VVAPSKVAGNASLGVKEGKVMSDSATLTRKGFATVRFLSHVYFLGAKKTELESRLHGKESKSLIVWQKF